MIASILKVKMSVSVDSVQDIFYASHELFFGTRFGILYFDNYTRCDNF